MGYRSLLKILGWLCIVTPSVLVSTASANWTLPDDHNNPQSPFSGCNYDSANLILTCNQQVNLNQGGTLTISTPSLTVNFADNLTLPAGTIVNPDSRPLTINAASISNNNAPLTLNANLVSRGDITLFGNANSNVTGNLQSDTDITLNGISVNGNVQGRNLTFDNGASVLGNAEMSGNISFNQGSLLGSARAGGNVVLNNNSLVRGSVLADGTISLNSGSIDGSATANGTITINNDSRVNASVTSQQAVTINLGSVGGSVTAQSFTMNNSSSVSGNVNVQTTATVNAGSIGGNLDANGNVTVESGGTVGSINSRGTVINRGRVLEYINANVVQNNGQVGQSCNINNNFGPCSVPPGAQLATTWCGDIWQRGETANSFYPPQVNLPEEALGFQLPAQLQPIDYLRRGDFGDVGENYVTNGSTSRIFVDGDLTIQPGRRLNINGPTEDFILVVTGNLTISADVQINGYVYARNITFAPRRCISGFIICFGYEANASITGALTSAGSIVRQGSGGAAHSPTITYRALTRALNGGRFCLNSPRTELAVRYNDGPFLGFAEDSSANRLSVRAINSPGYSTATPALPTNNNGFGTCGYTVLDPTRQQHFEVSNTPQLNFQGSFTVAAWVRPRSRAALMTIGSKNENYEFHIDANGRVNWWWNDRAGNIREFTSTQTVPLNQWSHVVIRYTPGQQTIFINGNATTAALPGGLRLNTQPVQIGSDQNAAGRYFDGFIDDFTIIRGALSNDEVNNLRTQRVSCRRDILVCEATSFDASGDFAQNWEVRAANVNGQVNLPRRVNNQLRLTDAIANQSAVASLRRSFPAQGNLIEVEFTANLFGGSGGDGMALVFSDARAAAVQGGSGGSLGYAPRNDIGQAGFNGAWLGIGFDQFGNFAQPSAAEGRVGGLALPRVETANRISMRGPSYAFVNNSQSPALSPPIGTTSTTRAPNHRYRVRLDTRIEGQALITVQRDTSGTGNNYQTVIDTFNLFTAQPLLQQRLPENLRLSFTASTGGSTNIHEIGNFRVCAERSFVLVPEVDHIRISHPGQQISCESAPLQITACADAQCTSPAVVASSALLQATSPATWSGPSVSGVSGANQAQINFQNGQAVAGLSLVAGGPVDIALSSAAPQPSSPDPLQCFVGGVRGPCRIDFITAGLQFYNPAQPFSTSLGPKTAATDYQVGLRAVETNLQTGACQARVFGNQTINLDFSCADPVSCVVGQHMLVTGMGEPRRIEATDNTIGERYSGTLPVTFNEDGQTTFLINYSDAGSIRLGASLNLPQTGTQPAVTLTGRSSPLVSVPATLALLAPAQGSSFDHNVGRFIAGEPFTLQVEARNASGQVTPNFGREQTPVVPEVSPQRLLRPEGGRFESGLFSTGELTLTAPGRYQSDNAVWNEAGSLVLRAQLPNNRYLAANANIGSEASIGRFYPFGFELDESSLLNACLSDTPFSYLGDPSIEAQYRLQAVNRAGNVLINYTDEPNTNYQARFGFTIMGSDIDDTRLFANPDNTPPDISNAAWSEGELVFNQPSADTPRLLGIQRQASNVEEGPYTGVELGLTVEQNPDNINDIGVFTLDGTVDMIFGRLVLDNLAGPEDETLNIIARVERWDGQRFVRHIADSCTQLTASNFVIGANPSNLNSSILPSAGEQVPLTLGLSSEDFGWSPAGASGEFEFSYQAPVWLRYNWDGSVEQGPSAVATFGQFRGNDRIIFWLERR